MEKEAQTSLMHYRRFREGKRFANKARQALPQGIVPAFHMRCFACFFADRCVLLCWDHCLICSPEIAEAVTYAEVFLLSIGRRPFQNGSKVFACWKYHLVFLQQSIPVYSVEASVAREESMSNTDQTVQIYQLRIWIREISPQIWRRLLVRSDSTIAQLHDILQIAFGWSDEHLHRFLIRGRPYGIGRSGGISFHDSPHQVRLRDFHFRCKERWTYEYDLTDDWQHEIRLEQILPLSPEKQYPMCLAGKRRAPLEGSGGPWAFMALRDRHPLFQVMPQFAQLLLDHRDELDDYQDEIQQLAYWTVYEDFDCIVYPL